MCYTNLILIRPTLLDFLINDRIDAADACIVACDKMYGVPNVTLKELDEPAKTSFGRGSRDIMGANDCNFLIAEIPVQ